MTNKRFEIEVEVVRLYTIPVYAENLVEAAKKAQTRHTAREIEEAGDCQDHEINVVGVTRQKGRRIYQ